MNWSKGFSASYYGTFVDPSTWRDTDRFEITSGNITISDSNLITSADVDVVDYDTTKERWVRFYLEAKQGGNAEKVALFTGLAISPDSSFHGNLKTNSLQCYSPLKVIDDILLTRGWFAPEGMTGEQILKQLFSPLPCRVEFEGETPTLVEHIVAEDNETNLSMAYKVLVAIGWRMKITGDGILRVLPKAKSWDVMIDPKENDIIEPDVTKSEDWFDCPNIYKAYSDTESVEVVDDKDSSPLSVQNRGRQIYMQETNCNLTRDESLVEYAIRRLKDAQKVELRCSYNRRFNPLIDVTDRIMLNYPKQEMNGVFEVVSQNISMSYGARVKESVVRV